MSSAELSIFSVLMDDLGGTLNKNGSGSDSEAVWVQQKVNQRRTTFFFGRNCDALQDEPNDKDGANDDNAEQCRASHRHPSTLHPT